MTAPRWEDMSNEERQEAFRKGMEAIGKIGETFTKGVASLMRTMKYNRARQATKTLRETLAEMKAKDVRGEYSGLDMFGQMLDQCDAYINHHQIFTERMLEEEDGQT